MLKVKLGFTNGYSLWMQTDNKGIITIGRKAKGQKAETLKNPSPAQISQFMGSATLPPQLALPEGEPNENKL